MECVNPKRLSKSIHTEAITESMLLHEVGLEFDTLVPVLAHFE